MSRRPPSKTSLKQQIAKKPSTGRSQTSVRGSVTSSARPSAASARPSVASAKPSTSTTRPSKLSTTTKPKTLETKEIKEFQLPALSLSYKPKVTESEIQKLKKRTIRRNHPPGENIGKIKEIIKNLKKQKITVQEFISLMVPVTADKGETLRVVMQEDLNAFRKLARKVYDTITQDNSDVLQNQQIQLTEFYKQKKTLLNDKMLRYIEEIYMIAPNFDFDRFIKEREKYLDELFPIPEELNIEPEEVEMMKRQAAYHRLQWLRSEGERLNEENNSLKKRLNQLKKMHQEERKKMMEMEVEAETKKQELEAQQAEKAHTLEKLNDSLEKSIIDKEKSLRTEADDKILLEPKKSGVTKKKSKQKIKKKPQWNEEAAKEIDSKALEKRKASEIKATGTKTKAKTEKRQRVSLMKISGASATSFAEKQLSPFHYSPPPSPPLGTIRSPPMAPTRPPSVTPTRSPAMGAMSSPPFGAMRSPTFGAMRSPFEATRSPPVEPPVAPPAAPSEESTGPVFSRRRPLAPRDTWGGFF